MTNNDTHTREIEEKLHNLLTEVKKVNADISETKKITTESFDAIESEVDTVIKDIDSVCQELQQVEGLTADEIDQLILEQAEDTAQE